MEIIEILRNNPFSHIQEEGRGWSYSVNKINSIYVNEEYFTRKWGFYLEGD